MPAYRPRHARQKGSTVKKILTREVRKWIYGVAIAAVPVLVYFGIIDVEASALVLPLLMAILNLNPEDVDRPEREPKQIPGT